MINWQAVEVGDVYETRGGDRVVIDIIQVADEDSRDEYPVRINHSDYIRDGSWYSHEPQSNNDIVAIHKPGTVGAMSHEERSRLWDKMEEYHIDVFSNLRGEHKWTAWASGEILADGNGQTRLEAVAACVAAIEQQQAKEPK